MASAFLFGVINGNPLVLCLMFVLRNFSVHLPLDLKKNAAVFYNVALGGGLEV